ncbi:MAG: hypothetical protein JOZ07_19105 [Solirubrobacterales bacterium]|nr:hypothetical protein [Solirubrobacterales bacterium]
MRSSAVEAKPREETGRGIVMLTLNRSDKRGAVDAELHEALTRALDRRC